MNADLINAAFEMLGSAFILISIRQTYKDKDVKGINPLTPLFFSVWGYWNLFYYPHLGQTLSFVAAAFLAACNTVWVAQLYYYSQEELS